MHGRTLVLTIALLLVAPTAAQAVSASTDCTGFQSALDGATTAGDVVTLTENCTGHFTTANAGITIQGSSPSIRLTADTGRALAWTNAGNGTLRNIQIWGDGTANVGGATITSALLPTVDHVTFSRNRVTGQGGGLFLETTSATGTLTLDSVIAGSPGNVNTASQDGGAVFVRAQNGAGILVKQSTFEGNTAGRFGGSVYLQAPSGSATLSDSTVTGSVAGPGDQPAGGGAFLTARNTTLLRNAFTQNMSVPNVSGAVALGGAVLLQGSESGGGNTLTNDTFTGNEIAQFGPGTDPITVSGGAAQINGAATLIGNTWKGNKLHLTGPNPGIGSAFSLGGFCGAGTHASLVGNDFVAGNSIDGPGQGAIATTGCSSGGTRAVSLVNVTLRANTAGSGVSGLYAPVSGTTLSIDNSILYGNVGGVEVGDWVPSIRYSDACTGGAAYAGTGNLCADPSFTAAGAGFIADGSPALDAGFNDLVPASVLAVFPAASRFLDANGDCTATVDMGAFEHAASTCTPAAVPPVTTPPAIAPPVITPPVITPPVVTPPVTDPGQVLLCEGRKAVLIDLHRSGKDLVLGGLSLKSLAGKRIRITADHGGGSATARIAKDGSFTARVPYPKSDQVSYTASYGSSRSSPLKVSRNLTVVSQKKIAGGLRIVARHSKGARVKGEKATVLAQTGCNKQTSVATLTFDKRGEVTYVLPLPRPPSTIAVYRLTTKVNQTFTLPIVVRR